MKHSDPLLLSAAAWLLLAGATSAQTPVAPERPSRANTDDARERSVFHWADADGNGLRDALLVRPGGEGRLLIADEAGGFLDRTDLFAPGSLDDVRDVAWGDREGDGVLELLVVERGGRARLFGSFGSGGYVELGDSAGLPARRDVVAAEWVDFDEDGRDDLVLQTRRRELLFRASTSGSFEPVPLGIEAIAGDATPAGPVTQVPRTIVPTDDAAVPSPSPDRAIGGRRPATVGDESVPSPGTDAEGLAGTPLGTPPSSFDPGDRPYADTDQRQVAAMPAIVDQATGGALYASSEPTAGLLFPLGVDLFVDAASRYVGMGTLTPATRLHLTGGTDVAPGGGGYFQLGASASDNIGIDSNEIMARSGGSASDLFLNAEGGDVSIGVNSTQNGLGIGTSSPEARLHVFDGSAGSMTAHSNSAAVFERSASSFVSILSPTGISKGLLFGNPDTNTSGGLIYDQASVGAESMQFRTGGNLTRMTITGSGNVGIGTTNPSGKLHVSGSSGDGTVVLPTSSIGTSELFGEMGMGSDIASNRLVQGSTVDLAGRTITAPTAGTVIVLGTTQGLQLNAVLAERLEVHLRHAQTGKRTPDFGMSLVAGIGIQDTITVQGFFDVEAGTNTFYMSAYTAAGLDINTFENRLSVIFVPTTYGTTETDD